MPGDQARIVHHGVPSEGLSFEQFLCQSCQGRVPVDPRHISEDGRISEKSKDQIKEYFQKLGIKKHSHTYTSGILEPSERSLLNQRERNILDIHYGLVTVARLQITGFGFWNALERWDMKNLAFWSCTFCSMTLWYDDMIWFYRTYTYLTMRALTNRPEPFWTIYGIICLQSILNWLGTVWNRSELFIESFRQSSLN